MGPSNPGSPGNVMKMVVKMEVSIVAF